MPHVACPHSFSAIAGLGLELSAEGELALLAGEAVAAGDDRGDDDAVPRLEVLHPAAHLHHLAHEFVAEDVAT